MIQGLIPGSIWQLSVDANCIPAGYYRFEEVQDEFLIFSVGSKISFGLTKEFYLPFLSPVPQSDQRTTSTDAFITTYAQLFEQQNLSLPGTQGMTYCVMHHSLQRKFRRLTRHKRHFERHVTVH
jgi:hypothetical protein